MKEIYLEVVTPSKSVFSGNIKSLSVPGTLGGFQVLFNHAPIISSFEIGIVSFTDETNKLFKYCTSGGTVEVQSNKIILLAETFESKEEIDIKRAKDAFERAKKRLSIENKEKIDVTRAEAALQRAINRLKFIK